MKRLFLASALCLASCAAANPPDPAGPDGASGCAVIGSADWAAWVNAMPGPEGSRPMLIVVGKVTVPTGGWRFDWSDARIMESYPVQVAVDLEAIPPAGAATQAVVTQEVRFSMPLQPPVGSVTVYCGARVLARIAPVETAH